MARGGGSPGSPGGVRGVLGIRGIAGSRAGERLWHGMGVGGVHGRGAGGGPRQGVGGGMRHAVGSGFFGEFKPDCALRRFSGGSSGRTLPGFPALLRCASRHIQAAPPGALMPCPRPIHAAPLALPFPSVRGRWRGWWRGAAGVPEITGGSGGLGHPGRYGLAGRGTPAAWQGSGRGPAAGLGFVFLREIRPDCAFRRFSAGPPGRSLPRFPAPPCSAPGPLMLALPTPPGCTSGTSLPRLGRSPVGTRASRAVLHSRLAPLALCGKEGRERWQRFP